MVIGFVCSGFVGVQAASVVVAPARLELEVAPEGAQAALSFLNRGDQPVAFALFVGMGSHSADGAPIFLDHPEARVEGDSLVKMDSSVVRLEPGEMRSIGLEFAPAPARVAAYPVVFAEFLPVDEEGGANAAMRSVARLAVPVLLTYQTTRDERRIAFHIEDVNAYPAADRGELVVDVTVRNVGNVHDWVRGRVDLVGGDGASMGEALLPEQRVLPGAVRTLRTTMALGEVDRLVGSLSVRAGSDSPALFPLRLVAMVYGDGWSSGPVLFTMPTATEVALATPVAGAGEEPAR